MGLGRHLVAAVAVAFCVLAAPAGAQQSAAPTIQPILVLSQERLLIESQKGRQLLAQEETMRNAHRDEGAALDASLEAEERELTKLRDTLPADEFNALAEAFDQKVVKVRQEHQAASVRLGEQIEGQRQTFLSQIVPLVADIMQRRGASLVFERRAVLFTGPNVDITPEVIELMDKAAGFD